MVSRQRRVELLERLEDAVEVLGGDADAGVPHVEDDTVALAVHADAHLAARRGELHGVGEQVEQHLPHAHRVAEQRRHGRGHVDEHGDAALPGLFADHAHRVVHDLADGQLGDVGAEPVGVRLGVVEDVRDQREQVPPAGLDLGHVLGLLVGERPVQLAGEDGRESDDGVERCPEFVAHGRELCGDRAGSRLLGLHRSDGGHFRCAFPACFVGCHAWACRPGAPRRHPDSSNEKAADRSE